jgi:CHAT domain-containing protein
MNAEMICGGPPEIARFMQLAHQGRIVHLAGHYRAAQPDCSGGGFVFAGSGNGKELPVQDEMLTMEEIESMHITPELLVLNACATGKDGNIQAATNILATLWNIPDILARDFMLDFYKYCLAGKSYSEALREVKLQWISCRATSLPVVWAPYVLTEK